MNRALLQLDRSALDSIHGHTMQVLRQTGVKFPCPAARDLFKRHGLKVLGETVFFHDKQIESTLEQVPQRFTLAARNPGRSIVIGDNNYVIAPGYGPPFIIESSGAMRQATIGDARQFYRLVQISPVLDFNSALVVQPGDLPPDSAHLDLLLAAITLTDKPIMGSAVSRQAALDSLQLGRLVFGDLQKPVMLALINSLSPLKYTPEMIDALMVYAGAGQPLIIHSGAHMGITGPITLAGSLVLSNAATLAGICLAQMVRPGTPIIYGLSGSPVDMRTGAYVNAAPENVRHVALAAAMGRYYRIPSRGQGALTESFGLDYQAGMESAMMMTAAALSGVHVGLHACGTMASLLAMSFEKFLVDEDLCGALKTLIQTLEINEDTFAMNLIRELGPRADYLTQTHTVARCRSAFFLPQMGIRTPHAKWLEMEPRDITARAGARLRERQASYRKPPIDEGLTQALNDFVLARKTS